MSYNKKMLDAIVDEELKIEKSRQAVTLASNRVQKLINRQRTTIQAFHLTNEKAYIRTPIIYRGFSLRHDRDGVFQINKVEVLE